MKRIAWFALAAAASSAALAVPEGPEPNTPDWFAREAANYARTLEAPQEQLSSPDFQLRWNQQSSANRQDWIDRALADPSWVGLPSGNSPNTPAGAMWSSVAVSDPTRYAQAEGPNGRAFYDHEGEVQTVVFYDRGCARISARLWAPRGWQDGDAPLPGVVIQNGSIQASQTMYWWMAQTLVRAGYVVMTFDPRGQGRSDLQTPGFEQGGNINSDVFFAGMVDAIDFFRASPVQPYPHNATCAGTYPTEVVDFNLFHDRLDAERLGIAGHSLGARGISAVQGYDGAAFAIPDAQGGNPVDVLVAWDALGLDENAPPRVPAMGQTGEYGIGGLAFRSPPEPEAHKTSYAAYVAAGVPAYQFTIAGSTHFEWSLVPGFPASSWCADISSGSCEGGWGMPMAAHYTLAWFDRWLKRPGEPGHDDADARLLDDASWCERYSFHFRSARSFADRSGKDHASEDIRAACLAGEVSTPGEAPQPGSGQAPSPGPSPDGDDGSRFGGAPGAVLLAVLGLAALRRRRAVRVLAVC